MNGELLCRCECCYGRAEHDRAVAEQAWDEGHDDGVTNMEQDSMIEAGLRERLTNPYLKE